ncbi:uncharacterized protein LOC106936497 [Tachysurus ichikawai]
MLKRKTRTRPIDDATSYILSSRDKPWLMEKFIDANKGRGVFTSQPIEQGTFVLEYRSTFLYEFEWKKQKWCIDASKEDGSLGRLVNDNHKFPNCVMKKVIVNDRPHLCLFAVRHIEAGTELDYNYGDSKWPWRIKVTNKQPSPMAADSEMVSDLSSQQKSQGEDVNTQVTIKQASPVPIEPENSYHDSNTPKGGTQIQMSFVGSDDSDLDSGEEYIPNPKDQSTDSDSSLELARPGTSESSRPGTSESSRPGTSGTSKSSRPGTSKSSRPGTSKSSSQNSFKYSSKSPIQIFPDSKAIMNEEEGVKTYSTNKRCSLS